MRVVCACVCGVRMRVWYACVRVYVVCACGMRVCVHAIVRQYGSDF